ncbi:uncharacterized protein LOC134254519 [Saccostrea cucullata]|uniref:uncharacterized protein LOC134254519 n=1 Tax=Saccostrea cuccullata TaxID=36930 RepID=UPI002ED3CA16
MAIPKPLKFHKNRQRVMSQGASNPAMASGSPVGMRDSIIPAASMPNAMGAPGMANPVTNAMSPPSAAMANQGMPMPDVMAGSMNPSSGMLSSSMSTPLLRDAAQLAMMTGTSMPVITQMMTTSPSMRTVLSMMSRLAGSMMARGPMTSMSSAPMMSASPMNSMMTSPMSTMPANSVTPMNTNAVMNMPSTNAMAPMATSPMMASPMTSMAANPTMPMTSPMAGSMAMSPSMMSSSGSPMPEALIMSNMPMGSSNLMGLDFLSPSARRALKKYTYHKYY